MMLHLWKTKTTTRKKAKVDISKCLHFDEQNTLHLIVTTKKSIYTRVEEKIMKIKRKYKIQDNLNKNHLNPTMQHKQAHK